MGYVSREELLRTSDLISLHVPLTPENHHMIGEEAFGMMKPGAILINTARGGPVDEAALLRAVDAGRLAGAGLDCIEHMPLRKDEPLLGRQNIIITPHVGGTSNDIASAMIPMLASVILDLYGGGDVRYTVNRAELARAAEERSGRCG